MSGDTLGAAVEALRRGELVILPTETVYGLAADARNGGAVARIFAAKGRPRFNPLIAHVADIVAARKLVRFDARAVALADAFWPGPLTMVAPARAGCVVSDLARSGLDTVAVRVPAHPVALALLRAFGAPVAAPSANRSGRPSPTRLSHALEEVGGAAAAALEGGACAVGLESTVVAIMPGGGVALLRPGAVTRAALEAVVGPLSAQIDPVMRSPGRLALHYAPDAPVRLDTETPGDGEAFLAFGPAPHRPLAWSLSPTRDLVEAAANLFALLHAADATRPTAIAIAPIPNDGLGEAINDRLRRAAGYVG